MLRSGRHFARLCHGRPTRSGTVCSVAFGDRHSKDEQIRLRNDDNNNNICHRRSCHRIASHCFSTCADDSDTINDSQSIKRVLLPTIGQNGTLIISSTSNNSIAQVQIIPQWREDALLELFPMSNDKIDKESIDNTAGKDSESATFHTESSNQQKFGALQLKSHADGITTSLGRKGALIEVDILNSSSDVQHPKKTCNTDTADAQPSLLKLVAMVPEKSNITCQIGSGDIHVTGKLEGDVHLATSNGNITVSKLRGHNVTLDTTTKAANDLDSTDIGTKKKSLGVIHVQKAIEAKSVQINTASRVRARMLNGSQVSVKVPSSTTQQSSFDKLDDDDEGALIDIGSLYISNGGSVDDAPDNEARLIVDDHDNKIPISSNYKNTSDQGGLVRVKSSHGHVTVHAKTKYQNVFSPASENEVQPPLIDLGGVSGSCDITLESSSSDIIRNPAPSSSAAEYLSHNISTRVHFDSMTPESISAITTCGQVGIASITVDRKLEADVRLLSVAKSGTVLPLHIVDAHSLTSDAMEDVRSTLMDVDSFVQSNAQDDGINRAADGSSLMSPNGGKDQQSISIKTDAYKGEWGLNALLNPENSNGNDQQTTQLSRGIEYTQGVMKNRSGEPDSRFDVRSRGKINIDGAASQALHGFRGNQEESGAAAAASPSNPLLVVATDGRIELETLSWFGSIARRYGLEEEGKEESRGVGRQASRAPRLDE